MRVGIDARFITNTPRRGIGAYSLNLVNELVSTYPEITFYLYIYRRDIEKSLPDAGNVHIRRIPLPLYPLWEQVGLPLAALRDGLDVLHCLGNTGPVFLFGRTRLILTIHDVMFMRANLLSLKSVNWYQRIGRLYWSMIAPMAIAKSSKVITVSMYSKKDILRYVSSASAKNIVVTYEGCDPMFEEYSPTSTPVTLDLSEDSPFILCLGAEDPRKNSIAAVRAFIALIEECSEDFNLNLIIVGYKNWQHSPDYSEVMRAGASNRIKFFSYISALDLINLYRSAVAFIYPSHYEGFGIPLLEAFNMGCPVIASNTSSIPEVGGNAPLYFSPDSVDELKGLLRKIIKDDHLRQSMIANGLERASNFKWSVIASKTMEIYKAVAAGASKS